MEKILTKYKVHYLSGGGTEYQDGVWTLKQTPKTITVEKVEENMSGVYANHKVGEAYRIGIGTRNPIKYADENSFTVYFQQAETPYIFTLI